MRLVTDLVTLERRERPYPLIVVLEVGAVAEEEGEGEPPRFRLGAGVWVAIVVFFVRRPLAFMAVKSGLEDQ